MITSPAKMQMLVERNDDPVRSIIGAKKLIKIRREPKFEFLSNLHKTAKLNGVLAILIFFKNFSLAFITLVF